MYYSSIVTTLVRNHTISTQNHWFLLYLYFLRFCYFSNFLFIFRIFPDERQNQSKSLYQTTRADRFGANRIDLKNPEKLKVLNESNKPWHQRILDPGSNIVLRWNRVYLVACLFALFIDPFFYYLPLIRQNGNGSSCVAKDQGLSIRITVLRSLADLFYMLNIAIKFHTAYVDPKSRVLGKGELVVDIKKIQRRYIRTDFFVDILAAVPLPQVKASRRLVAAALVA
jgi:cyclic nucleotide gated channel, plant